MKSITRTFATACVLMCGVGLGAPPDGPQDISFQAPAAWSVMPAGLFAEDQQLVASEVRRLEQKLSGLRTGLDPLREPAKADRFADADLFHKGICWALRYETNLAPNDVELLKKSLQRGHERADLLLAGQSP